MMYAKYQNGAFTISYNPEMGGVKGNDKGALWRQIRRNAAYIRDMAINGFVYFRVYSPCGRVLTSVILYRDGRKDSYTQGDM